MNFVPILLDVLLGALLLAALYLGVRLEKRLKALRDSHQGFAQAVSDLDRAAARAEQGLADLRAATDEAAEVLAARIEKAQILSGKLELLTDRAAAVPPAAVSGAAGRERAGLPTRESFLRPAVASPAAAAPPPRTRQARVDDDIFAEDTRRPQRTAVGRR